MFGRCSIFPTLLELSSGSKFLEDVINGSVLQPRLDGKSLVKYMRPGAVVNDSVAITQLVRCTDSANPKDKASYRQWKSPCKSRPAGYFSDGSHKAVIDGKLRQWSWTGEKRLSLMGYSIRTQAHRYTAWLQWNSSELTANWEYRELFEEELYLHPVDEEEVIRDNHGGNLAAIEVENVLAGANAKTFASTARRLFHIMKHKLHGQEGSGDHLFNPILALWPPYVPVKKS